MSKKPTNSLTTNWKTTLFLAIILIWASTDKAPSWTNILVGFVGIALLIISFEAWQKSKAQKNSTK